MEKYETKYMHIKQLEKERDILEYEEENLSKDDNLEEKIE